MKTKKLLLSLALLASFAASSFAQDSKKLRETLMDMNAHNAFHWIYNDLDQAKKEARRAGKPIFVTFRCVPCEACKGFDAEVANGNEAIKKLQNQSFISLRQVEMKGVDLNLFQFDHDLNWAAMFINADGTIYGRYGTQSSKGPDAYNSTESLLKAMKRVLELHADYPNNIASLAGKRGPKRAYSTALEMPGMENKAKLKGPTKRDNCVHCHNIHDAQNLHAFDTGKLTPEFLWRYPLPDNLGIEIDPRDGQRVKSVATGSAAGKAGVRAGSMISKVNGQPIISIADIQWVLHNLPNEDQTISIVSETGGKRAAHSLRLAKGWKETDFSWRGSVWSIPPRMRIWMPPAKPQELRKAGLPEDTDAVAARWINTGTEAGRGAKKAGLRTGDVILSIDGKPTANLDHKELNMHIKLKYKPGDKLPVTVSRNGKTVKLELPLFR